MSDLSSLPTGPSAPAVPPPPGGPSGTPRWVKLLLVVSLALNLAVAGLVAGVVLKSGGGGPRGAQVRDLGFGPFSEALGAEDREALRRGFMERAPNLRELRQTLREDGAEVLAALRAEPFDPARLAAVLAGQGERIAKRLALGQDLLAQRIAEMTPEARAAFADRLEDSLSHRGDHHGNREGERGLDRQGGQDGNRGGTAP
jgi:uncharacterized membrane protein